jgi:glycosyltransferase involved in cell wall biosynthesis
MQDNKVNILYISSFGSLKGGGQRSLLLLIKYLDQKIFTPFLIVPDEDELAQEANKLGVRTFILPFPRVSSLNLFSTISGLIKLRKIVKNYHIDIIHTDAPRDTFYAALVGNFFDTRIVFHARVADYFWWLDKIVYYLADSVIAVSQSVARRFRMLDKKNKVKVVYNGVELDIFRPSQRHDADSERPLTIGYFGKIERRKGVEVLLRAVKQIGRGLETVIVGDGDARYLEELQNLAGSRRVIFKYYKKDIVEELSKVDIVVLPSLKGEGLPRLLIEGMAMGKIVIASDVSAHKEVLGDDLKEFIFPAGDDNNLAAIINRIIDDRNIMHEIRDIARKKAELLFEIKQKTKEIENIYSVLLKTKFK